MTKQIEPTVTPRVRFKPDSRIKLVRFAVAAVAVAVVIDLAEAPRISAQVSAPAFEVASVKLTDSRTGYIRTEPGRLTARGRTLASLILRAYGLQDYQLTHGPAVSLAERCDIDAEAEGPAEPEQLYRMLQTLLADRFQLVVHHETKELPVFVLSVGKNQPRLHEAKDRDAPAMRYESSQQGDRSFLQLVGHRASLSLLAGFLGSQLGHPVMDETGLKGEFDFTAELTAVAPAANDSSPPVKGTAVDPSSVIAAIRADLGLKLESAKRQVDVLVVDHVEKLLAN